MSVKLFSSITLLLLAVQFQLQTISVNGAIVNEKLVISRRLVSPDNFVQWGILINGQFPGPPIYVNPHDTLVIELVNNATEPFGLHSHGILQVGSLTSDGVPWVTQDPILPNSSYTYRINIGSQSGTFMYHAHTGLDLVWAFGALIIRDTNNETSNSSVYSYDEERILLISQCWHVPIQDIYKGLLAVPFEDVPDTSSVLINGHSWGVWDVSNGTLGGDEDKFQSVNDTGTGYEVIRVKQGQTYRFRVVGLGMDSMLTFSIEGHSQFEVIEVDGVLTDPVKTDRLQLNSAQRYSILVKMDQPLGNYWIKGEMYPGPGPKNGRAILHYEGAEEPTEMRTQVFEGETEEEELDSWILDQLHPSRSLNQSVVYPVPDGVDRQIVVTSFQKQVESGQTKFDINGVLHRSSDEGPVLLHELEEGRDILENREYGVYEILLGERIQLVFENWMSDEGECEQHPWHTHGHTFYVVGNGPDSFDPVMDAKAIDENIANMNGTNGFPFRDVVTLFPSQRVENKTGGAACGWTAVRFIADNPGLWLVHCHLTPHQIMGKHFVLYEHPIGNPSVRVERESEDPASSASESDSSDFISSTLKLLISFVLGVNN